MPQLRKVLQGAGATFSHWYVNTPVCCPSRSETLSGRYHHNLRNVRFQRQTSGAWCGGDEAVGEEHDCGCMNINNTALPEALMFQASTYADFLQRAEYTTGYCELPLRCVALDWAPLPPLPRVVALGATEDLAVSGLSLTDRGLRILLIVMLRALI